MKPQRRPIEGALVSGFDLMVLAEPDQLSKIPPDAAKQLHLYLICRRPRIGVVPEEFSATEETCHVVFVAHCGEELRRIEVDTPNYLGTADVQMRSKWPHGDFELVTSAGERVSWGRSSVLLTMVSGGNEHLDLEVLYVGQAYGTEGGRSAVTRLSSHETLQAIYGEAVRRSPDKDVFALLLGLDDPYGLIMFSPVPGIEKDLTSDWRRLTTPVSEQQRINFTEAALIRYFAAPYNNDYKHTFPSPAHKTYAECYDLDVNSVAFEMATDEIVRARLYSETVPASWYHSRSFPLHDSDERRDMFDFSPDDE